MSANWVRPRMSHKLKEKSCQMDLTFRPLGDEGSPRYRNTSMYKNANADCRKFEFYYNACRKSDSGAFSTYYRQVHIFSVNNPRPKFRFVCNFNILFIVLECGNPLSFEHEVYRLGERRSRISILSLSWGKKNI